MDGDVVMIGCFFFSLFRAVIRILGSHEPFNSKYSPSLMHSEGFQRFSVLRQPTPFLYSSCKLQIHQIDARVYSGLTPYYNNYNTLSLVYPTYSF